MEKKIIIGLKFNKSDHLTLLRHVFILLLISILLFSFIAIFGTIASHDGLYHFNIIRSLDAAYKNGTFGSRILDLIAQDYGYGTGLFYSLMPAGICVIFMNIFNIEASTALALELALISFLSSLMVYFFLMRVSQNRKVSLLCSIFYMFFPYFIVNCYIRFAFSEIFLMLAIPLICRSIYELLFKNDKIRFLVFFVFGYSLAIINHLATTVYITIVLFIYLCLNFKKFFSNKNWLIFLLGCIFTLMISACFYIPMLINFGDVQTLSIAASGQGLWETTISVYEFPGSYYLLYCFFVVLFIYFVFSFNYFKQKRPKNLRNLFVISTICFWLITPLFPWVLFGFVPFSLIQFAWRLFNLNSITCCFMLFYIIKNFKHKNFANAIKYLVLGFELICIFLFILFSVPFSTTQINTLVSSDSGLNYNLGTGSGKSGDYYPTGLTLEYLSNRGVDTLIYETSDDMEVYEITNSQQLCQLSFVIDYPTDGYVILNIPYEICENLEILEVDKYSLDSFDISLNIEPYQTNEKTLIKINTTLYDDKDVKFIINYEQNGNFDQYLKNNPFEFVVKSGEALFSNFIKNSSSEYSAQVETNQTTVIELPSLFYKGYNITYVTENETYELEAVHGENGFIEITVSESGTIFVEFEADYVSVSNWISVSGIVLFFGTVTCVILINKKKSHEKIQIKNVKN